MSIYLDNAATSFPKPESVYLACDQAARTYGANPGRGSYKIARKAAQIITSTRESIARLFNITSSSQIAFTSNATHGINTALLGLISPGQRVVTTSMEHNAVARPLYALEQNGVEVEKVQADVTGLVDAEEIFAACSRKNTHLVLMSHCSNVSGSIQPIAQVGTWCRQQGIPFMLDAAQSAGILPIDVESMGVDILAAPGHKGLLGPQGTGFVYIRKGLQVEPLTRGGTGNLSSQLEQPVEMPELLESGTLNTAGLAGLHAGVEFILEYGRDRIYLHELDLTTQLWNGLGAIPGIQLYGPTPGDKHTGPVSFNLAGREAAEIGFLLDRQCDIAVRTGLHCAPQAHKSLGSFPAGSVRVSPGFFNTSADISTLLDAIKTIAA